MSTEIKHQQVLDLVKNGMPAYKAYMKVYPDCTERNAQRNAYRIFKTENEGMKQALIDAGLDNGTLANALKEMIESKNDKKAAVELALKINGAFAPTKTEVKAEVVNISNILNELEK